MVICTYGEIFSLMVSQLVTEAILIQTTLLHYNECKIVNMGTFKYSNQKKKQVEQN